MKQPRRGPHNSATRIKPTIIAWRCFANMVSDAGSLRPTTMRVSINSEHRERTSASSTRCTGLQASSTSSSLSNGRTLLVTRMNP